MLRRVTTDWAINPAFVVWARVEQLGDAWHLVFLQQGDTSPRAVSGPEEQVREALAGLCLPTPL